MKALTTWGSYYVLRENVLGSLEPDKYADFIVLDRDYLSVPEDDIPNIRVLMTVVGGKTMHLLPSLARESGMEPERVPPPEGQNRWRTTTLNVPLGGTRGRSAGSYPQRQSFNAIYPIALFGVQRITRFIINSGGPVEDPFRNGLCSSP